MYPENVQSKHAKKVSEPSTQRPDGCTIDRIGIVGMSYPPGLRQLATIYRIIASTLAEMKGMKMTIRSQEANLESSLNTQACD